LADVPPYGARYGSAGGAGDDGWGPATPVRAGGSGHSGGSGADRSHRRSPRRAPVMPGGTTTLPPLPRDMDPRPRERGLASWAALVVLLIIAGIGGLIDSLSGTQVRGGFNIGIIIAAIVAILLVRRSGMFPIVIAPPIVYSVASGAMLYIRSSGLSDHKALYDAAANWLVYGFPAIAGATAAVLIIAGIRMLSRR
jgi:hypothetical protein